MGIKTTIVIAGLFSLMSTSAFAGTADAAPQTAHVVKAPVLLKASTTKTTKLRIKRVVVEPVQAMVARDASTADHGPFVYKTDMNPKTKTYLPAKSKSASMPNLFTK